MEHKVSGLGVLCGKWTWHRRREDGRIPDPWIGVLQMCWYVETLGVLDFPCFDLNRFLLRTMASMWTIETRTGGPVPRHHVKAGKLQRLRSEVSWAELYPLSIGWFPKTQRTVNLCFPWTNVFYQNTSLYIVAWFFGGSLRYMYVWSQWLNWPFNVCVYLTLYGTPKTCKTRLFCWSSLQPSAPAKKGRQPSIYSEYGNLDPREAEQCQERSRRWSQWCTSVSQGIQSPPVTPMVDVVEESARIIGLGLAPTKKCLWTSVLSNFC